LLKDLLELLLGEHGVDDVHYGGLVFFIELGYQAERSALGGSTWPFSIFLFRRLSEDIANNNKAQ